MIIYIIPFHTYQWNISTILFSNDIIPLPNIEIQLKKFPNFQLIAKCDHSMGKSLTKFYSLNIVIPLPKINNVFKLNNFAPKCRNVVLKSAIEVQILLEQNYNIAYCETKVWLILILMITKQGLELMIIFQV